ncbi:MAG: MBL fold metallo-hydrolase [Bacteroidales bacterium]|nr:MAG: MBL fold metallo-hydrolase [Bacteroidales bacterium]
MTNELSKNIEALADSIQWFGQASVKIQYLGKTIYIDPFNLKESDQADLILITHPHFDHYSEEDIKKIATPETVIFCPTELVESANKLGVAKVYGVVAGFETEWKGISIKAVPAYNIVKFDKHPKERGWVGFILTLGHIRIYHAGDTERIPEMKHIRCDIILLPLGQTYTMNTVEDAANAALDTNASIAIPIHYGLYEGKRQDAEQFKSLLMGKIEVIIPVMN